MTVDWTFRRRTNWVLWGVLLVVVVLLPVEWRAKVLPLGILLSIVLFIALGTFVTFAMNFRKQYPVGAALRSGFGSESFVVEQPKSTTRLDYDFYRGARRRGPLAMMKFGKYLWVPYPGALFGDEDLARFNSPKKPR